MATALSIPPSSNCDNDSYTSLTPVNELQPFSLVGSSTFPSVRTAASTSDASTPQYESRAMPNTYRPQSVSCSVKASPSNTLKDVQRENGNNDNSGLTQPQLKKQEIFCYSRCKDSQGTASHFPEFREMRDRASSVDSEFFPSTSGSVYENKTNQEDSDTCRQSSSGSGFSAPTTQRKSTAEPEVSGCIFRQNSMDNKLSSKCDAPPDSDYSGYTTSRSR